MIFNRCFPIVISVLFFSLILTADVSAQEKVQTATKVGRYQLQSNPWVNLHQRLLYASRFKTAPPAALSGDDLLKWNKVVEAYRKYFGKRSPIFDDELIQLNAALSATRASKLPSSISKKVSRALETAMPLYRLVQWEEDDRANRFCIAVVTPMLTSAAEELADAHAKAYGMPFPKNILVDIAAFGWQFGAYTVGEGEYAHVVIQSTDRANQGFMALESLMHEPSHAIVGATSGAIGADLTRVAKELGVKPMSNLWHAIMFYTSGELTRRALAKRGVSDYKPIITEMYSGPFRGYRQPLEIHWQAYLDGNISREKAIRKILIETSPGKNDDLGVVLAGGVLFSKNQIMKVAHSSPHLRIQLRNQGRKPPVAPEDSRKLHD
jgi:hypothetical protein